MVIQSHLIGGLFIKSLAKSYEISRNNPLDFKLNSLIKTVDYYIIINIDIQGEKMAVNFSVANTLKSADHLNEVAARLYGCTTADQISDVFSNYNIESPEDKKELLHRCMNVEEYFDAPHDALAAEDEYEYIVSVFIEGTWRFLAHG